MYTLLWERWDAHRPCDLNALGQEFGNQEMDQLVTILQHPVSQANREQALRDYIRTIQTEAIKGRNDNSALMAFRAQKKPTEELP